MKGLTEAERQRERQRSRINRQRCGEEVRERAVQSLKESVIVLLNNAVNQIESGLEKGDNTKQCRDFCEVELQKRAEIPEKLTQKTTELCASSCATVQEGT